MAAGFQFFSHADAGMPVLRGQAGSLIALLDYLLVTMGGWAKVYTGSNLAAYRSGSGNRFYMRVDDTQATYSRVRAYRAMTAVSTGTNQFPSNTQAGNINTWGVRKAYQAGALAQRFWGVRTDRYLVLVIESTDVPTVGVAHRNWIVFGDVPSVAEADAHNTLLCGQPNVDQYYLDLIGGSMYMDALFPGFGYNATQAGAAISGTPNGSVASPLCGAHFPYQGAADGQKASLALSDRLFFAPIIVGSTNSASTNNGAAPRARLPNVQALYGPCADGAADPQLPATDLVAFSIGPRQFLPVNRYANGTSGYNVEAVLIEITDTDGAL